MSAILCAVALVFIVGKLDERAQAQGFLNMSDKNAAERAGVTDPAEWKRRREADEEATQKAAAAERERKEKEVAQKAAEAATREAAEQAACKADLKCWGEKHSIAGSVYCRPYVERLAANNFEWYDSLLEPKFSHYRWANRASGVITLIGDKVKFQNGFGAWIIHTYECDFDPVAKRVVDVRARQGRIPLN
ncbi:hypothetical protein [Phreatobacter stygius]|uniref:Uncharacterized protein n=1 Tax=Phreatobacter stygius TaxID=1940610 RepID=A0A4D7B7P8_9HYPH|nr:hypothetical protein [Phreatobacter stygius]QCI65666.1 hypothetical protein E8M01_16490 [Phreatobacter stygius]